MSNHAGQGPIKLPVVLHAFNSRGVGDIVSADGKWKVYDIELHAARMIVAALNATQPTSRPVSQGPIALPVRVFQADEDVHLMYDATGECQLEGTREFVEQVATALNATQSAAGPYTVGDDATPDRGPMYRVLDRNGNSIAYAPSVSDARQIAAALNATQGAAVEPAPAPAAGGERCPSCDGTKRAYIMRSDALGHVRGGYEDCTRCTEPAPAPAAGWSWTPTNETRLRHIISRSRPMSTNDEIWLSNCIRAAIAEIERLQADLSERERYEAQRRDDIAR